MTDEDLAFLRAIHAAPANPAPRLIYADWLDEHADPRADYLRLGCRLADLMPGHPDAPSVRRRMVAARPGLDPEWLALIGDFRAGPAETAVGRIIEAARRLGRPVKFVAGDGYDMEIIAAALHPSGDVIAYVECRQRDLGGSVDIDYYLKVRAGDRESSRSIESYNPYFGCEVGFLEWFGDEALAVYREKHWTFACRFGLGPGAAFQKISDFWMIDGPHLGFRAYQQLDVRRLSVPGLAELPSLTESEAALWELLPPNRW